MANYYIKKLAYIYCYDHHQIPNVISKQIELHRIKKYITVFVSAFTWSIDRGGLSCKTDIYLSLQWNDLVSLGMKADKVQRY